MEVLRRDDLTLKGIAGRALGDHGMTVTFHVLDIDDYFYDTYAEIRGHQPRPARKRNSPNQRRGSLWWECPIHHSGTTTGITLADIAATITRARHIPCHV